MCKAFTPVWFEVGQVISDDKAKVQVADFDCHLNKKSCDELWVESYPTFMWIDEGEKDFILKPTLTEQKERFCEKKI